MSCFTEAICNISEIACLCEWANDNQHKRTSEYEINLHSRLNYMYRSYGTCYYFKKFLVSRSRNVYQH